MNHLDYRYQERTARLHEMLRTVAWTRGYLPEEISGPSHRHELVSVRREFAVKAREAGYSLPQIGAALKRHHTSILHLIRTALGGT